MRHYTKVVPYAPQYRSKSLIPLALVVPNDEDGLSKDKPSEVEHDLTALVYRSRTAKDHALLALPGAEHEVPVLDGT